MAARPAPRTSAKSKPKPKPPVLKSFIRRRLRESTALLLAICGLLIVVSLLSYSPADPCFNKSGDEAIRNDAGLIGAYAADVLMQTTGLANVLLIACCFAWGWRLLHRRQVLGLLIRVTALMVGLVSFATALSVIPAWSSWPVAAGLGGSVGMLVASWVSTLLPQWATILLFGVASVALMPLAIGFNRKEWLTIAVVCGAITRMMWRAMRLVHHAFRGASDRQENEDDDAEQDEEAISPSRGRARVKAEAPPPKLYVKKIVSKAEREEEDDDVHQGTLELMPRFENYEMPSVSLLTKAPLKAKKKKVNDSSLTQNAELLEKVLLDFGVKGEITRVRPGPVVTLYELEPSAGTKSSRVIGLADDIARSMSAVSARIAVVPGKNALGIEMPNTDREIVYMREMLEHETYKETEARLPLVLGKDISGEPVIADLARMPHLLVAGTTGSGKSVAINTMIMSLVYHLSPEQCRFIMIDPKMLELSVYDGIPHLLSPVVTEPGKAVVALKWTVKEMENRYRLMSNLGVRNIDNYNKRIRDAGKKGEELFRTVQTGFDPNTGKPIMEKVAIDMNPLPFIVVVVDEMADLMLVAGKDIESSVQRLAQMARAAGIHIIMATQRPSVDVITGVIKANFPTRISFQVTSKIDSRTILGEQGAEQLLGQGDMLYMAGGGRIQRVHGPFIADKEVENIVSFLKEQGEPEYIEDVTKEDEEADVSYGNADDSDEDRTLYDEAVQIVLRDQKASTSYIQRKLKIGYNRAARIIDQMEQEGLVGAANHVGKREVLHRAAS